MVLSGSLVLIRRTIARVRRSFQGRIREATGVARDAEGRKRNPRADTSAAHFMAATSAMIEQISSYRANKGLPHEEVNKLERGRFELGTRSFAIRVFG